MISKNQIKSLLQTYIPVGSPCISIYAPTHKMHPDNEGDPLRYKNLVQDAERIAEEKYARRHWEDTFNALYDLVKARTSLWQYTKSGLAVFACGSTIEVFHLEYQPESLAVVGSEFHVLPLFAYMEQRAQVLLVDLSKDRIRLYKATRFDYEPFESDEIKMEFPELFDDFDADATLNFGTYTGGAEGAYHGHRAKPEEVEKDREKYFRYLDLTIPKITSGEKVLLAGTTENLAAFRQIAKSNVYLESEIDQPLDSIDDRDRQARIANALAPLLTAQSVKHQEELGRAMADKRTVHEHDVARKAAEEGRLSALYVNLSKFRSGDTSLDDLIMKGLSAGADIHALELPEAIRGEWYGILRY